MVQHGIVMWLSNPKSITIERQHCTKKWEVGHFLVSMVLMMSACAVYCCHTVWLQGAQMINLYQLAKFCLLAFLLRGEWQAVFVESTVFPVIWYFLKERLRSFSSVSKMAEYRLDESPSFPLVNWLQHLCIKAECLYETAHLFIVGWPNVFFCSDMSSFHVLTGESWGVINWWKCPVFIVSQETIKHVLKERFFKKNKVNKVVRHLWVIFKYLCSLG